MDKILNISNGTCATAIMQQANIPGSFLAWNDLLHAGPVPQNLSLTELSTVRTQFIADCGWGTKSDIAQSFAARDQILINFKRYAKIILWFEHDLYDQLQLIQILAWFQQVPLHNVQLSIICTDQYLGMQTPKSMLALLKHEQAITEKQLQTAKQAWDALRADTPEQWQQLLQKDTAALPFLKGTILRLLEEYPSSFNGLSRTSHIALDIIATNPCRPEQAFARYQKTEERRFLGDSSFWLILEQFLACQTPLITLATGRNLNIPSTEKQLLSITQTGKDILVGKQNWLDLYEPNFWIGGVHLATNNIWCWDTKFTQIQLLGHKN
ncbi:MAG: hypothetical protein methR_P2448 [Methyloprofundus sp.]|nr:MAG: hypothetical protein methR_P2448 [Methyloprofundus sp.]